MNDERHDDPANWKFGIFYFNKNDKRIVLPKRNGNLGWTLNFANPYSILAIAALVGLVIAITRI
jgi:uncharacterized membrane protein